MPDNFSGEDLTCVRGERVVFAGLSFSLSAGDALVLRGPNGSGKSSLLRLMAGLGRPAAGRLIWNDADTREDRTAHHARLTYVGHQDALKPALTARENLAFWAGLRGASDGVGPALDALGLAPLADVPARFLSAGERRRLTLARLPANRAPLWLLDEPTVGLDDASLAALLGLLSAHQRAGGMVVLTTHGALAVEAERTLSMTAFAVGRPADADGPSPPGA